MENKEPDFLDAVREYLISNGLKNVIKLHLVDIDEYLEVKRKKEENVEEYFITVVDNGVSNRKHNIEFYISSKDANKTKKFSEKLRKVLCEDERAIEYKWIKYKWMFNMYDSNGNEFNIKVARDGGNEPYLYDLNVYYTFIYQVEFTFRN